MGSRVFAARPMTSSRESQDKSAAKMPFLRQGIPALRNKGKGNSLPICGAVNSPLCVLRACALPRYNFFSRARDS